MSSGRIEVSPKYGVNSTIPLCFWCGEEKDEIALFGRLRERNQQTGRAIPGSDVKVPTNMVLDYNPCRKCQEIMSKGITLIGVTFCINDSRPPIGNDSDGIPLYPTGSYVIAKKESFQGVEVEDGSKCLIPEEELQKILPKQNQAS